MLFLSKTQHILSQFINQKESRKLIYQLSKLNQDNQQTFKLNNQDHELSSTYQSDQLTKDQSTKDLSTNDLSTNDLSTKDQLNKDLSITDLLTNNQPTEDQSTGDQLEKSSRNSLIDLVLRVSTLKPRKSYETKVYGNYEMDILKVNRRNFLIYDENSEFVRKSIECLGDGLGLSANDAREIFFQLSFLRDLDFKRLFANHKLLELELRKLNQILDGEQLKADLNSIKFYEGYLKVRHSILKLLGLNSNFSSIKSFTMIMCQTESNLKELNLIEKDVNLLEHILKQMDIDDKLKQTIRSKHSEKFTTYELLSKISNCYFLSTFNFNFSKLSRTPLNYLDLLNVLNTVSFINRKFGEFNGEITKKNYKSKQFQRLMSKNRSLLRIDYDGLELVDAYLNENNLNFIWKHLLNSDSIATSFGVLARMDRFLPKIDFLIQNRVPADLIDKHFYLFFTKQNQLKFFFNNFGDSFLEYFDIPLALSQHHQIIQKFSQLSDEDKKNLTFNQFMDNHFKS